MLSDFIESKNVQTDLCIERVRIAKTRGINIAGFGCKIVFEYVITEESIDTNMKTKLDAQCITGENSPLNIEIKASKLKLLKEKWNQYMKGFCRDLQCKSS